MRPRLGCMLTTATLLAGAVDDVRADLIPAGKRRVPHRVEIDLSSVSDLEAEGWRFYFLDMEFLDAKVPRQLTEHVTRLSGPREGFRVAAVPAQAVSEFEQRGREGSRSALKVADIAATETIPVARYVPEGSWVNKRTTKLRVRALDDGELHVSISRSDDAPPVLAVMSCVALAALLLLYVRRRKRVNGLGTA